jgi:hypothetical protein
MNVEAYRKGLLAIESTLSGRLRRDTTEADALT